ncbi:hypothetical protein [Bradyrhizobium sp. BR 1432]
MTNLISKSMGNLLASRSRCIEVILPLRMDYHREPRKNEIGDQVCTSGD